MSETGGPNAADTVAGGTSNRRGLWILGSVVGFMVIAAASFLITMALTGDDAPGADVELENRDATSAADDAEEDGDGSEQEPVAGDEDDVLVELDGLLVHDASGVYVVSDDGERAMILNQPVEVAFDDGEGGLLYQLDRGGSGHRDDLVNQPLPRNKDEAVIWHLPAGEDEPVLFRAPAWSTDGNPAGAPDVSLGLRDVGTDADGEPVVLYIEYRHQEDCTNSSGPTSCDSLRERQTWVESLDHRRSQVRLPADIETLDGVGSPSQYSPETISVRDGVFAGQTVWGFHDVWLTHGQVDEGTIEPIGENECDFSCAIGYLALIDGNSWLWDKGFTGADGTVGRIGICSLDAPTDCERPRIDYPTGRVTARMIGSEGILRVEVVGDGEGRPEYEYLLLDLAGGADPDLTRLEVSGEVTLMWAPILRPRNSSATGLGSA